MATLREFQLALQEKLEELRQRDELICELEDELAEKETAVERLKAEVRKLRALMGAGGHPTPAPAHHAPLLSVPSIGSGRSGQARHSSGHVSFYHLRPDQQRSDAPSAASTLIAPTPTGNALPRFRLPQPHTSALRTRVGLAKTFSSDREPPVTLSSSSSGESAENAQTTTGKTTTILNM